MFQIGETIRLTCKARDYESNAIWTGQIGVKTNILCQNIAVAIL